MIKNLMVYAAAAGLALAPVAAQAGIRAGDSSVSLEQSFGRVGSPVNGENKLAGGSEILLIGLFIAAALAIIVAVENSEDDASPGTGG